MRVKRSLLSAMLLVSLLPVASLPAIAQTVPFDISITNTLPQTTYPWSAGLLTLAPVLPLGASPQPGTPAYAAYSFANSNCDYDDTFCSGSCNDNGNAVVLAQRLGLTLGVNAWLVPALNGNNTTATVHIDVPQGAKLSFIAWINNTSVFDDFVAMHVLGNKLDLSVPLFDAQGAPLNDVVFGVDGYDTNSTSATDGSGDTCSQECPAQTTGCYVTWNNASAGTYPAQPTTVTTPLSLTATGPATTANGAATYVFAYQNTTGAQLTNTTLKYVLPTGATYVSSTNGGSYNNTTRTVTWTLNTLNVNASGTRSVSVTLPVGTTLHSATASYTRSSRAYNVVSNVISTLYSTALTATCTFTDSGGRFTDGLSVGQLAGGTNSAREIAVVLPRGSATAGGVAVLNNNCVEQSRTSLPAGRDTQGFPLVQDLNNSASSAEYAFGEGMSTPNQGALIARTGASASYWSAMPWGYPGFWNMGPSGADLVGNSNPDTLLADWDGHLAVVGNNSTTVAAQTDFWASDGEHAFGHVALADVIGTTALEAVVFGYTKGTVTAFTGSTLAKAWQSASLRTLYGDFAYGTGPAIGDLDGDGNAEIVVTTYGSTSDVYAFSPKTQATGSTCKYRFDPGGMFTYTSPVIGDVDGSGRKSVVTISSSDGVVSVMKAASSTGCTAGGTIVWQYTIKAGEGSAFAPLLYDVNGDGTLDVIAASQTRLVVLDVRNRTLLHTFDDSSATFAPSAVVVDSDSGSATSTGAHELWVTGWRNSKVYRINLPVTADAPTEWNTFGGAPARTGAR